MIHTHTRNNRVFACKYSQQTLPRASSWRCLWLSSSSAAPALWEAQSRHQQSPTGIHCGGSLWWQCQCGRNTPVVLTTLLIKMLHFCPTWGCEVAFSLMDNKFYNQKYVKKKLQSWRRSSQDLANGKERWKVCDANWGLKMYSLFFLCLCVWNDDQSVDDHVDQQGSHGGIEDSTGQQLICEVDWKQVRLTGTWQPARKHQHKYKHRHLDNDAGR